MVEGCARHGKLDPEPLVFSVEVEGKSETSNP